MATLGPISAGNIINAAIVIYRSHYKTYLPVALASILWGIVPLYGWAKSATLQAAIGRQVYQEIVGAPETIKETLSHLNPKLWQFWWQQVLIVLYMIVIFFLVSGVIGLVLQLLQELFVTILDEFNGVLSLVAALFVLLQFLVALLIVVRFYSQIIFAEIPLGVELELTPSSSLARCWKLSTGAINHIQWAVTIGSLVTMAVFSGLSAIGFPLTILLSIGTGSPFLSQMFILGISTLIVPFWQAIKALIYYDLRCRREGLDILLPSRIAPS